MMGLYFHSGKNAAYNSRERPSMILTTKPLAENGPDESDHHNQTYPKIHVHVIPIHVPSSRAPKESYPTISVRVSCCSIPLQKKGKREKSTKIILAALKLYRMK
jgi:hypothetical protein